MHPLASSILFHAIGAACTACCYAPQKRVREWSWQSYWLTQASFCWLLLPVLGALLTVPGFWQVVREAPPDAMLRTFLLGAAYGVGGTAFGVAIHMILLILLGTLIGVAFGEWRGVKARTRRTLVLAVALLIAGKLMLDYGNLLGSRQPPAAGSAAP